MGVIEPAATCAGPFEFCPFKTTHAYQKAATWQAYQALSPEEKQKLAILATPKPVGAAAAIKPVAPQKLAAVPVTRQTPKQLPKIAVSNHAVDKKTLLPHPKSPVVPSTAQQN